MTPTPSSPASDRSREPYRIAHYTPPPPPGPWEYILEDPDILFGPGWWPFYLTAATTPRSPVAVRLAVETKYWAWNLQHNTEHVTLKPQGNGGASARLDFYQRPRGLGARIAQVELTLDIRARTFTIAPECPPSLTEQARLKGQRPRDYVLLARSERGRGWKRPWTARDQHIRTIARVWGNRDGHPSDPLAQYARSGRITINTLVALEALQEEEREDPGRTQRERDDLRLLISEVTAAGKRPRSVAWEQR
jgi:hypothetical protein